MTDRTTVSDDLIESVMSLDAESKDRTMVTREFDGIEAVASTDKQDADEMEEDE